jgi:hypothetical protein
MPADVENRSTRIDDGDRDVRDQDEATVHGSQ